MGDGQLQRACLARALVLRPRWLICEMTAMVDAATTAALVAAVEDHRAATGASLLAVGHDPVLLDRWCNRTLHWDDVTGRTPPTTGRLPQASGLREPSVVPPAGER